MELTSSIHSVRNRNRVEIQKIYPVIPKCELSINNAHSVLGVSLHAPASEGNKMLAIFNFLIKQQASTINVFIGDGLYRYTAMLKYGCDEQEGRAMGECESARLQAKYTHFLQQYTTSQINLNFLPSSKLEQHPEFSVIHNKLLDLFEHNANFKLSVLNFANYYFSRTFISSSLIEEKKQQIHYSCKYLIEELAICGLLNKLGFNTFIYPGVIQTLYEIIAMDEPYLQELFENYRLISLRLKRV